MIIGIGIDIIEVARVQKASEKEGFRARVFSARELEAFASRGNATQSMAGAFAAKEAVAKALGTGIGGDAALNDIEILHDDFGAPYAELSGAARSTMERMGGRRLHISISHIKETAVAEAILEG